MLKRLLHTCDPAPPYTPLDPAKKEIRLLRFRNQRCTTKVVSLLDNPHYECISYRWGDPSITEPLQLNGKTIMITTNLAVALRRFKGTWIWADAVCIKQDDDQERATQVAMMGEIYSKAARVRVWIPQDENAERARLCRKALDSFANDTHTPEWRARNMLKPLREMTGLFKDPYWTRLWILQELVLARRVRLYYGSLVYDLKVPWSEIGVALMLQARDTTIEYGSDVDDQDIYDGLFRSGLAVIRIGDAQRRENLYSLFATGVAECGRVHDYAYGMLAIVPFTVPISYHLPWQDVFVDFTYQAILASNLSIIIQAVPWQGPSWAVDLSSKTRRSITIIPTSYDASKGVPCYAHLDGGLHVKAVLLGTIASLHTGSWDTFLECISIVPIHDVVRTLLRDDNMYNRRADNASRMTDDDVAGLIAEIQPLLDGEEDTGQFLTLGSPLCNQQFFTTPGSYGLVGGAQLGDQLAVLAGCSVPVCLRPCNGGYNYISAVYLAGYMDGEAVDRQWTDVILV